MTPKFVSLSFASKWHRIGTQYQDYPSRRSAINAACDDGHEILCWEACSAFGAGYAGLPLEVKAWQRLGNIPMGYDGYAAPSTNYAQTESELGVSVADQKWLDSFNGLWMRETSNRPLITFRGIQVGYGSDGEPVVLPVEEESQ